MAITPQTNLKLLKVPIEIDLKNQLTFTSLENQFNYFNGLNKLEVEGFSYQRADNIIRYPAHIDSIINYNYCMYQNYNYTNKWFYAFITGMRYVNDNMTDISIKTDVYQTWLFDVNFKPCFIEREHVSDDTVGKNTYPEGLETGEYISGYSVNSNVGQTHIVMGTTVSPIDGVSRVTGGLYGGIYSGVKYYVFQSNNDLNSALSRIAINGNSDSIVSLFYCPDFITDYNNITFPSIGVAEVPRTDSASIGMGLAIPLRPNVIDGYTPKNNKLFVYPYTAYLVSNNSGSSVTYHLEDFLYDNDHQIGELEIFGTCCPGASLRIVPKYYKISDTTFGSTYNNEYGLNGGKFPEASWGNDAYTNWLTQNSLNIALDTTFNLANMAVASDNNSTGGVLSGLQGIGNTLTEMNKHTFNSMVASGNTNSGDVTFSMNKLTYTGYFMSVKKEYAEKIDNFWSMFGYKVNITKMPNIMSRSNWNYIKTIDCNLEGYIPQTDLQELKDMFNNGVTFWHNPTTFLDYSQTNSIVS